MVDLSEFPTTRFQGSKRKILPWIWEHVRNIPFQTVLDAFGGTGSVSYLFKKMGKTVTYNDSLHFNYLVGKALIENNQVLLTNDDVEWLVNLHAGVKYQMFITDNFKGMYFLDNENRWLDIVNSNIIQMKCSDLIELSYKQSLAYYSLFQASLMKRPFNLFHRSNLSLRTRNVVRSFGNKVTWDKSFDDLFRRFCKEANDLILDTGKICLATNMSVFQIDPHGYELVYLDPPYFRSVGANETSDYFRCYHFLEGMSQYANWPNVVHSKSEIMKSNFRSDNIYEKFEQMIEKFRNNVIVLSYKRGGIPSIDFITSVLKKLGKKVHTRSIHYSYALNHQNGDARKNRECIILGV